VNILALNAGSSTLKYRLHRMVGADAADTLVEGTVEHVAGQTTAAAAQTAVERCLSLGVAAVGHRIVHGGARFTEPTLVTQAVLDSIRQLQYLAPLHNPVGAAVIEAAARLLPHVPQVAVFDTAFHRTLPEVAALYAIPYELSTGGLRRYGFHGISYRYVTGRLLECLQREPAGTRLIICHLGNGASVCAVRDGHSVDTSMGFTPLEGLVMGTRSGDIDPGLLLHLQTAQGKSPAELDDLLNRQSGLLGVSGQSGDVRALEKAVAAGDARAELALAMFAYRVRKYIGAYVAALGGVDAVAFTAGIGEHSAALRQRTCAGLESLGLVLDPRLNQGAVPGARRISADDSQVPVWVVPTDEERQIVRETYEVVHRG
jgi:acetate kinase